MNRHCFGSKYSAVYLGDKIKRPPIIKIFILHIIVSLVICSVFWLINGRVAAYSSLIGGVLFAVPQLYFGFKAFLYMGARSIHMVLQNFYRGESTKMLLIAIGFGGVFHYVSPLDHLALLFTFVCILLLNGVSPALFEQSERKEP